MNKRLAAVTAITCMLAGCLAMAPGHLYPVGGPLSTQTPVPIYKVTLNGVLTSGSMTATLPDGEVCSGGWAAIPQDDPTAGSMSADWDSVYGAGFFVANVLGKPVFARDTLTGTKGTTLQVQFYDPKPGGIAGDQQEMSASRFGTQAANYLTSAVHSTGADLERLKALVGQLRPARALDLGCGAGHGSGRTLGGHRRDCAGDTAIRYDAASRRIPA